MPPSLPNLPLWLFCSFYPSHGDKNLVDQEQIDASVNTSYTYTLLSEYETESFYGKPKVQNNLLSLPVRSVRVLERRVRGMVRSGTEEEQGGFHPGPGLACTSGLVPVRLIPESCYL